jgi:hypothetical protein
MASIYSAALLLSNGLGPRLGLRPRLEARQTVALVEDIEYLQLS